VQVSSVPPLVVAPFVWQPRAGAFVLTILGKATYALHPGVSPLVMAPSAPLPQDLYWDDNPFGSVHTPTDFVPFKRAVDILVGGHAYAPPGEARAFLVARLAVGPVNKAVGVVGDRQWMPNGGLSEPIPFSKMPLRWERTAGGPDTWNPVGLRPSIPGQAPMFWPAPNLEPVGFRLQSPTQLGPPIGLGALAPSWPSRADHLRHHASGWKHATWHERPLPPDVGAAYFNAAASDQQIDKLPAQFQMVLDHLHPEHPRLVTVLEDACPLAVITRRGAAPQELWMRCDTLFIDTDQGSCTLTWRASVPLARPQEDVVVRVNPTRVAATTQVAPDATRAGPRAHAPIPAPTRFPSVAPPVAPAVALKLMSAPAPRPIQNEPAPARMEVEEPITLVPDSSEDFETARDIQVRAAGPARPMLSGAAPAAPAAPAPGRAEANLSPRFVPPFSAPSGETLQPIELEADEIEPYDIEDEETAALSPNALSVASPPAPPASALSFKSPIWASAPASDAPAEAPARRVGSQTLVPSQTLGAPQSAGKPVLPFRGAARRTAPMPQPSAAPPLPTDDDDGWVTLVPRGAPQPAAPALPFKAPEPKIAPAPEASAQRPAPAPMDSHADEWATLVPLGAPQSTAPALPFKAPEPKIAPALEASAQRPAPIHSGADEWATLVPLGAPQSTAPVLPFASASPPADRPPDSREGPVTASAPSHARSATLPLGLTGPAASPLPFQSAPPLEARPLLSALPAQVPPTQSPSPDRLEPDLERRPSTQAAAWSPLAPSGLPFLSTSPPAAPPPAPEPPNDRINAPAERAEATPGKAALSVEHYARIKMELWGGKASLSEVLERHGIDEVEWRIHERRQADALANEAHGGRCDLALALMAALESAAA
jgi:hypothetical protein